MRGRWQRFFREDPITGIGELLALSGSKMDLQERIHWAERVFAWLKHDGESSDSRFKFFFQFLEQNPKIKQDFRASFEVLLQECSFLSFFLNTGYTNEHGLWSEVTARIIDRFLPAPATNDIRAVFIPTFESAEDYAWIEGLSEGTLLGLHELFSGGEFEGIWREVSSDLEEALIILATGVAHHGLSLGIRSRILHRHPIADASFLELNVGIQKLISESGWAYNSRKSDKIRFHDLLARCRANIEDVYEHIEEAGVSVSTVHRLETISASLDRIESLLHFEIERTEIAQLRTFAWFLAIVARTAEEDRSIKSHIGRHFYLLARKIVERNGQSGEHYIARNAKEMLGLFVSALGGGAVVVFMTLMKIIVMGFALPPLFQALAVWFVYSSGFLAMQAFGFTLATKIPSFAATRLTQWIRDARNRNDVKLFAAEVIPVIYSQVLGLMGNVVTVLAGAWLVHIGLNQIPGLPKILEDGYAVKILESLNPLTGPVVFLGALTGVQLWASSICGGWFENFVVFRGIPEAIAEHSRLRKIFGADFARRYADVFMKNASDIATNVSLGFFFAFVPLFGSLWGLGLQSKHVTIETASATFALTSLDMLIDRSTLFYAIGGLALIGVVNFVVSFSLAMVIAIRAQNVHRAWVWHLVESLWSSPKKSEKDSK